VRTWEDNRAAINGLWPMMQLTEEEKKLWHDDLSPLDQDVLYDAIRNVKRSHDTLYPQIKWVRDEHRTLSRLRQLSDKRSKPNAEPRQTVNIPKEDDQRAGEEIREYIDGCVPSQWREAVDFIADQAARCKIELATAFRLGRYLNERLGMSNGGPIS
jgi:hypothetical protein